ncbi:Plastocyanin-like protein [Corchorus olitorius]|uniref:Plastocyanin-like protein n=1 Tax=Corchorus olitorius TaxID=93759 RepID=A0A1R3JYQ3_9ROSI|nr:Plastocyanin-like protein [Corchorus olitorius]
MAVLRTLVGLAATALLIQLAMAANYTVGGPNGSWDSSTDLQTWVAAQKFEVGDNLIFQYLPNHDVLEVSKPDYDNCQTSSPIQTHNDGNTVIPLTAPGKRYFICGTMGHCDQGMKIEIDTLASSTPPPTTSPSTPAPKSSPSPANSPEPTPDVPSSSPDVPSTESPGTSPSPSGISSPPPPSSAYRASFQTSLTLAFGPVLMVLLAL